MTIRNRIERLEQESRFRDWLRFERYLEFVSDQQLEFFAVFGYWPDPPPPEPPPGTSRLDSLPQKELIRLFKADERKHAKFAHRSDEEKEFFSIHGHWPEEMCQSPDCQKPWSDELRRKYQSGPSSGMGQPVVEQD